MVRIIISLLILIVCIFIIVYKRESPLYWYMGGIFLFNSDISLFGIHIIYLFTIVLLISVLLRKDGIKIILEFPLAQIFLIYILGIFFLGLVGPNISFFDRFVFPVKKILSTVITLPLCYYYATKEKSNDVFVEICMKLWFFVFLYGLFEFVFAWNPINNLISSIYGNNQIDFFTKKSVHFGRFLGTSLYNASFNFGYVSSVFGLLSIYLYSTSKRKIYLISSLAGILGCLFCGSRSVILACFIGYIFYLINAISFQRNFKIALVSIPIILIIIFNVPLFKDLVDSTLNVIGGGDEFVGSSLEMRMTQYRAVATLFKKSPIVGNGLFYFVEVLGWDAQNRPYGGIFDQIQGLESYLFNLMIEQGVFGIILAILLFSSLFYYYVKNKKTDNQLASLGLSYVVLFLAFSMATGELGSWWYTMPFIGKIIAQLNYKNIGDCEILV
jgi:hypothetical protein